MKPYRIELTRPSPWSQRLAVAIVALSILVLLVQGVRLARDRWGGQERVSDRHIPAPPNAQAGPDMMPLAGRSAAELAKAAGMDNGLILDCIESATNAATRVVRINIDALDRRVQLEVDATQHDEILAVVHRLGQAPCPGPWRLDRWRDVAGGGVQGTVSVDLVMLRGR